jgi:aminoglycoside phosphotransferase (APT) family kinase protein
MLVDDGRLVGVIDFGDAIIGDIAYDFAPLRHSGDEFMNACVESYRAQGGILGPDFEHRIRRYSELRSGSFFSMQYALAFEDSDELSDCIAQLRRGPILRGSSGTF